MSLLFLIVKINRRSTFLFFIERGVAMCTLNHSISHFTMMFRIDVISPKKHKITDYFKVFLKIISRSCFFIDGTFYRVTVIMLAYYHWPPSFNKKQLPIVIKINIRKMMLWKSPPRMPVIFGLIKIETDKSPTHGNEISLFCLELLR